MNLLERLRGAVQRLRRTPMPIADVIPMLQQAADALESKDDGMCGGNACCFPYSTGCTTCRLERQKRTREAFPVIDGNVPYADLSGNRELSMSMFASKEDYFKATAERLQLHDPWDLWKSARDTA